MLLRQLVTPIVFVFWLISKKHGFELLSAFFVLVFSGVLLASYPNIEVSYLWVTYCLGVYVYGDHVSGDHVFAACFAVLSAHFGGWLYEIPFFHPASMFYSTRYPWLVNTQILSGLFCIYLLIKREIKANKTMLYATLGYVATSLFWIADYHIYFPIKLWWLPRLGAMVLLWSALTGLDHKPLIHKHNT